MAIQPSNHLKIYSISQTKQNYKNLLSKKWDNSNPEKIYQLAEKKDMK